jgi:serine protease Do
LRERGKVLRGWLGVYIQKVTEELAAEFKLDKTRGALVADVMDDGPAKKAGIQKGDVITEFNNQAIEKMEELPLVVAQTKPGATVPVKLIRDGKEKTIQVSVGTLSDDVVAAAQRPAPEINEKFGMSVQNVTDDIAENLGLSDKNGVLVSNVESGGAAEKSGIRRGDLIVEVNRKTITNVQGFEDTLKSVKDKSSVLMLVKRGDNTLFVAVKQPKEKG